MKEPTLEEINKLVTFTRGKDGKLYIKNVTSDIFGNVESDILGNVNGNIFGNLNGDVHGNVHAEIFFIRKPKL